MSAHPPRRSDDVHHHQIDELASQLECDPALVADVYWTELSGLQRSARLQDFLPVFAARRTRDRIKRIGRRGR